MKIDSQKKSYVGRGLEESQVHVVLTQWNCYGPE